jgi:hypothetical protein
MARRIERLSSAKVRHAKPGMHADGGGLYLQVTQSKDGKQLNKSWLFRFKRGGRERQMRLGSLQTVGLAEARQEGERQRKLLLEGLDPIAPSDASRASQGVTKVKAVTFEWCAMRYMAAHEAGWRNAETGSSDAQRWRRMFIP